MRVQRTPPLLQEAPIGYLVGEGVLEGVGELWEEARFVEELGGLQVPEPTVQRLLGQLRDGLQQQEGDLGADDRRGLEQTLLLGLAGGRSAPPGRPAPWLAPEYFREASRGDRRLDSPTSTPVSTRVRTLSSRKKGLPSVRSIKRCVSGSRRRRPREGPGGVPQRSPGAAGRAGAACSRSCCPSRVGTPGGN